MKTLQEWLGEGEEMYNSLLAELERVQQQINELQQTVTQKKTEVNQIAGVIGKPGIDRPPPALLAGGRPAGVNQPVKML